jgi:hypothetical protein
VWTTLDWQGLSSRLQHWSVQPCVRAVFARHTGNAALANSIARLVSAVHILGTFPSTAPVEGWTATVPPLSAATHSPATKQASRNKVGSLTVSFETS